MNEKEFQQPMTLKQFEAYKARVIQEDLEQKQLEQKVRANAIHRIETRIRGGEFRIQQADVDFIKMAANKANDVNDFLAVV